MPPMKPRKYISIYFEDGDKSGRKKRDFNIAVNLDEPLYEKCQNLSSTSIKEIIGIHSYEELSEIAKEEGRSPSNLIKFRLARALSNE